MGIYIEREVCHRQAVEQLSLSVAGLGAEQILPMPKDATLGDLARTLADQHEDASLVRLVMPGNVVPSPLDARAPLAGFFL